MIRAPVKTPTSAANSAVVFLLVILVLLCAAGTVTAQRPKPPSVSQSDWQFGFDLFHMLLEQKGLFTSPDFVQTLQGNPPETVVVLVGDLSRMPKWSWSHLRTFLHRGGAALIASDQAGHISNLCSIEGGPVQVSSGYRAYQGFADCPRVTSLDSNHRLMRGVREIVANRCGWISKIWKQRGRWHMVAHLPRESRKRGRSVSGKPLIATLAARGSRTGRLVVVADHSIFINGMLWHGDNAMFVLNLTDWLCHNERRKLLFVIDGRLVQSGMLASSLLTPDQLPESIPPASLADLPDLPKESWLTFANSIVTGLEDSDVLNDLAARRPREINDAIYRRYLYFLLATVAAVVALILIVRAGRRIERPNVRTVKTAREIRMRELLQSSDFRPAARELARELFQTLTGSDDPQVWMFPAEDIQLAGGLLQRRTARRALWRLIRIASDVDQRNISRREFNSLAKSIERLHALHQQGRLIYRGFNYA